MPVANVTYENMYNMTGDCVMYNNCSNASPPNVGEYSLDNSVILPETFKPTDLVAVVTVIILITALVLAKIIAKSFNLNLTSFGGKVKRNERVEDTVGCTQEEILALNHKMKRRESV